MAYVAYKLSMRQPLRHCPLRVLLYYLQSAIMIPIQPEPRYNVHTSRLNGCLCKRQPLLASLFPLLKQYDALIFVPQSRDQACLVIPEEGGGNVQGFEKNLLGESGERVVVLYQDWTADK